MTQDTDEAQILENMRFYADARFKQLSLFLAAMTVCGAGVAKSPELTLAPALPVRSALTAIALLITGVLWVMEVRAALYWFAHRELIPSAWPRPAVHWPWMNATNLLLLLYSSIFFGWLGLAYFLDTHWVLLLLGSGAGVFLGAFSLRNYSPYWSTAEPPPVESPRPRLPLFERGLGEAEGSGRANEVPAKRTEE